MAEHVGAATRFPSLTVRVNESNLISFTRAGVQVPAIDLLQTYRALFLEEPAAAKAKQRQQFKLHGSILDVVLEQAKTLKGQLGKQDQHKFEEYLDSVRSLEKKIVQQEPWVDRPKPKTASRAASRQGHGGRSQGDDGADCAGDPDRLHASDHPFVRLC